MKLFIFMFLVWIHSSAAVTHSLKYFYTASSQIPNFPEFVTLGLVDDFPISYYDSNIGREVPKQDWMKKHSDEFWQRNTQIYQGSQQWFKNGIEILKQRFNQTGGVHIVQWMYGCEWDDETDQVKGHHQYGYDGEDFIALDLKTESWVAPNQQAVITKNKWDNDKVNTAHRKNYLQHLCPDWVKKYVNYGRSSLMRTALPSVSLLQKTSSSPVSCHATGFYPQRAELMWRKDGEEIHENVVKGEILPNNDGTFQMTVDLYSVAPEDWNKYECVFQLRGEEDLVTRLVKTRSNEGNSSMLIIPIVVAAAILVVVAVIGFILYKKRNAKRPPSPAESTDVNKSFLPETQP